MWKVFEESTQISFSFLGILALSSIQENAGLFNKPRMVTGQCEQFFLGEQRCDHILLSTHNLVSILYTYSHQQIVRCYQYQRWGCQISNYRHSCGFSVLDDLFSCQVQVTLMADGFQWFSSSNMLGDSTSVLIQCCRFNNIDVHLTLLQIQQPLL